MFDYGTHEEDGAGTWGGHAITDVGQNETTGLYGTVTWGAEIGCTHAFHDRYCDEVYAVVDLADWLGGNKATPSGLDLKTLQADCKQLGMAV